MRIEQGAAAEQARKRAKGHDWCAAALLGLLAGAFSTAAASLGAGRVGRAAEVDWMVVGTVLLRDQGLRAEVGWLEVGAGVLVHQAADLCWALIFFGLLGRWTAGLRPVTIAALALAWAVLTWAAEYVLVLPWLQPILLLEQPYWVGLAVHVLSASLYPLFPWLREQVTTSPPLNRHRRAAFVVAGLAGSFLVTLAALATLGGAGHEVGWPTISAAEFDEHFVRDMAARQRVGVALARLGAEQAGNIELRAAARLMAANQVAEGAVLRRWWRSWFGPAAEPLSVADLAAMPGMPSASDWTRLRGAVLDSKFDMDFAQAIAAHHAGSIATAKRATSYARDPRLRIMASGIAHARRSEIAWMDAALSGVAWPERAALMAAPRP